MAKAAGFSSFKRRRGRGRAQMTAGPLPGLAAVGPARRASRQRVVRGKTTTAFGNDPNEQYQFQYKVVELDDLVASNTDTGAINPDYDPTLQPRDRTRVASRRQVDQAARAFVPAAVLVDFHQLDKGAPIVGDDNMVESGNGRTLALRRMRQLYPEQWQAYQAALRDNAAASGVSEEELARLENPILVRERLTAVDRAEFAREANTSAVLRMSTVETAEQDKRHLSDAALTNFEVREGQNIDNALRAASNRDFVRKFTGSLPPTERAAIMRGDGTLNRMGLWRIKAAMFARVFPGQSGERVAETFLESLDSRVKNFETGLAGALPAVARAEGQISAGARRRELDMSEDFSKSIDMLARLRESGTPVPDYLGQGSLFERETTPLQDRLIAHFNDVGRSSKKVREFFTGYAEAIDRSQNPNQLGLFGSGGGTETKEDIVNQLIERSKR